MALLDLQGLEIPGHSHGGGGGSSLTVATCQSRSPSNLSLLACHF
jgi:Lanthionine-containing peptide SapB precursor RamS